MVGIVPMSRHSVASWNTKQIEHKEIEYEKPGVIMQKVMRLEKEISKDIDEIRTML
jgi:hypothetical protein